MDGVRPVKLTLVILALAVAPPVGVKTANAATFSKILLMFFIFGFPVHTANYGPF